MSSLCQEDTLIYSTLDFSSPIIHSKTQEELIRIAVEQAMKKERKKIRKEERERMQWQSIDRGHYTRNPEDYKISFGMNKKGPQLNSKTNIALRSISKMHQTHKINYPNTKLISIVFTNNSLLEGAQWQSRTAATFKGTDIVCQRLASDSIEKEKDFSKASQLIAAFYTYSGSSKREHLGDILIMCNHPTRINDISTLIDVCAGNGESERNGTEFRFNIFFDEYDKPKLRYLMMKFIKKMYSKNLTYMINHIQLISGTTPSEIIRDLKKIAPEAAKMLNIQKCFKEEGDELSDYRTILTQEYIEHEGPEAAVDYVRSLDEKYFEKGKIYFIPSHWYTKKQEEFTQLKVFKERGYWILIINGKNKELRSPLGEIQKINLKKKDKNGNRQELYNILSKWRNENPNAGLVITGNDCIERGLTFLTNGFDFDYMIISNYFRNNLYKLVQIGGRGQGKSEYVNDFKIIMPQALYDRMKKYIEDDEKLTNAEHDYYDEDLLANIGKEDPFLMIHVHSELSIDALARWINLNLKNKNKKPARMAKSLWKKKETDENGFIKHKFGEYGEKVWSEEEALKVRGGLSEDSHRIFPCYTNLQDRNSLKWYVFYNDGTENEN